MTAADPFLAAINAAPADPDPKSVYADWLEERGAFEEALALRWLARLGKWPEWVEYTRVPWPSGAVSSWAPGRWFWHTRRVGHGVAETSRLPPLLRLLLVTHCEDNELAGGEDSFALATLLRALEVVALALADLRDMVRTT